MDANRTDSGRAPRELKDARDFRLLADYLETGEEDSESVPRLRRGTCRAWITGESSRPECAVIQWNDLPAEPVGFGDDAETLFGMLSSVEGWECVDCDSVDVAKRLGRLIEEKLKTRVSYSESILCRLLGPVVKIRHVAVRLFTPDDVGIVNEAFVAESVSANHGDPREFIRNAGLGFNAGPVVQGKIVGLIGGDVTEGPFADMGAFIMKEHRGRGYGTAAASLVAERLREVGKLPSWGTGEHNLAALRLLNKLGFTEILPRGCYVVPEKPASRSKPS